MGEVLVDWTVEYRAAIALEGSRVDTAGGRLRVSVPLRLPILMSVMVYFSVLRSQTSVC